ncbi:MAG TPA: sensor histidine kinase [Azospirillaceae bacterium]|nr:sensor histidine kinase [Azospirillaceae bacterium]
MTIETLDVTDDPAVLRAELAALRRELARKDVLLRELAHRAQNGPEALAALIAQEVRQVRDPAARAALEMAGDRVAALARVHELLARHEQEARVALCPVLRELFQALGRALSAEDRRIAISVGGLAPPLPAERALPLALIAHELVANALRYGFRGRAGGRVEVQLREREGGLVLTVRDDGIGISEKTLRTGSTGLWLVRALAAQIEADVQFRREDGTVVTVAVPPPR